MKPITNCYFDMNKIGNLGKTVEKNIGTEIYNKPETPHYLTKERNTD
jgi:hypothetical protein